MTRVPVTDADLHAYADEMLAPERRKAVDDYLAAHQEDLDRVRSWQEQNRALRAAFDPVLDEPIPERMLSRTRSAMHPLARYAAVAAVFAAGIAVGWTSHLVTATRSADVMAFARQAAIAHAVYSPEVRHPVEVGADQEAHLVRWLSKRLGASLKIPQLNAIGYQLVGGRLLPGNQGPVAQFMYQDVNGLRFTLYVRTSGADAKETAFRFAQERGVSVFYWLDGKFGYALSGEMEKAELLRVAQAVYQQFNP